MGSMITPCSSAATHPAHCDSRRSRVVGHRQRKARATASGPRGGRKTLLSQGLARAPHASVRSGTCNSYRSPWSFSPSGGPGRAPGAALPADGRARRLYEVFPVVDGERLVGCATTRDVKELPRDEWTRQAVGAIAKPCTEENTLTADADAVEALAKMHRSKASRLMVVDGERLVAVLSLKYLLSFLSMRLELSEV